MRRRQLCLTILAFLALIIVAGVAPAYGQTYSEVYNFGSKSNDGSSPSYAGIIAQGRDGNLYTTAPLGGAIGNNGAVVKITPAGTEAVLYSFDGTHGSGPAGGLTLGLDGNFYGTAYTAGSSCCGTIFKITPGGVLTVLYNFTGGSDGARPNAPPIQGIDGNWYGTTTGGGSGFGTVYKLTASGTFTSLYQFDNAHGYQPQAPLVQGTDGSFYGTTLFGGAHGLGEIFKITAAGVLTVVYSFDGTIGQFPVSPLIQGLDGNFYGTTGSGGTADSGAVFKMTPAGVVTELHGVSGSAEGADPQGGVVQASDGNLYGVEAAGSGASTGTFFKLTTKGAFTVLHYFSGVDGSAPRVTPLQHTSGIIYGDTSSGGTGNVSPCTTGSCGVFYSVNSTLPAFIKLLPYSGKVGSKIGILGQGFSAASVVKFNGVTATTVTRTGTTFLLATVPAGASDGFVTVTTGTTTLKSLKKFTVHNSWKSGAAMPTALQGGAVGVINGKIYVVGGATAGAIVGDNQIYNPSTNTWTTGAPMPAPRFVPASAVVNGVLYVFGGIGDTSQTPLTTVQAYNPATNTWSTKAPMPTADDSMSAVVENGLVYVIGGYTGTRSAIVQRYNPATNTWGSEAPMLTGKSGSMLGLLGTTIISSGGLDNGGNPTGDTEGYNAATNKWSALKADATVRNGGCGGAVSGQLYVTGGSTAGLSGSATTQTESFNLSKNAWTTLAPAPVAVINAMSAVANSQLYCFGGSNDGRLFQGSVFSNVQNYQP